MIAQAGLFLIDTLTGFLTVLFPHDEVCILDYNRVVYDWGGLSVGEFFARVEKKFIYMAE